MTYGYPNTHVFYRKLTRGYPRIVRGEGCYLYDDGGRRYLDGCGGAFVANLGHGVAEIAEAVAAQAGRLGYVSGMAFTHPSVEELAAEIARLSPGDLDLVYPLCSGSEAIEAALKYARKATGKPGVVALEGSFHGRTIGALSVTGQPTKRKAFEPLLDEDPHKMLIIGAPDRTEALGRAVRRAGVAVHAVQSEPTYLEILPPGISKGTALRAMIEALGIGEKIPFEIWIDGQGLPRRQRISMDFGDLVPGTEGASMDMTIDLSDFGEPVDIKVPRRSEVTDMTETLAGAGAGSGAYG